MPKILRLAKPSAVLLLACAGCRIVLDIDDKYLVPSTGAADATGAGGAGASGAGGAGATGGEGGVGGEERACTDTLHDPGNCGACGHDCLGGLCDAGHCTPLTIFTADDACAYDLALPGDGYVYFTDYYPLISRDGQTILSPPRVWRMRDDGSEREEIFNTGDAYLNPSALAVDDENVFVAVYGYFLGTGSIWRFAKDGSDPIELTAMWSGPRAIAIDSGEAYFTSANGPAEIAKVSKAGGDGQVLYDAPDGARLYSIALDDDSVYFSDYDHGVLRMDKAGGPVATVDDSTANPFPVLVDGAYVYWHDLIGLWRKPKDGSGVVEQIAFGSEAWDLAADGDYIYMTSPAGAEVRRSPKTPTGQSEEVIATGYNARSVVVDSEAIYWSSLDALCRITKLAK